MRIVICGDTHIGAIFGLGRSNQTGGNTRIDDYASTFNYIVDYCILNKVDAFVQTGDLFEHRAPSTEHMEIANACIKRLSIANIATFILMGNHDFKKTGDTFTSAITSLSAKDFPNVRMVLEPQVASIQNEDGDSANLLLLPFRDKKMYPGNSTQECSEKYEEHIQELIGFSKSPLVAIGHNFYYEGSYSDYSGKELLPKVEAFAGCDLVAMGHLHQFRPMRKENPTAIYTGSMEKTNFADADVDKFIFDYETKSKKLKTVKLPVRDLIDPEIDATGCDPTDVIQFVSDELTKLDVKNKIVRVNVLIKEALAPQLKKRELEKVLYDNGAFFVSKVNTKPVKEKTVKDLTILSLKSDHEIFKAFIMQQSMDDDFRNKIIEELSNIF